MATEKDILDLFDFLTTVYPPNVQQEKHLDGLITVWSRSFAGTPAPVLKRAAELYMAKGKWFPKPAEILEHIPEADRQVSHEEQGRAAGQHIDGLRQRLLELETAYWHEGLFDCDAWEKLIADFEAAGWNANAAHCRAFAEMASVSDAVEISQDAEISC